MQLLGGLNYQGRREQGVYFAPASGALEMRLHDARAHSRTHPQWVSNALACVLAEIGGESVNVDRIRDLCVADRQYLALQWRLQHGEPRQWFSAICPACDARYDFTLDWRELPVKSAAAEFPFAVAHTRFGDVQVRAPNGWDQEAIAHLCSSGQLSADVDARRWLATRLVLAENFDAGACDESDIVAIETAVEAMSPEVATEVNTQCPECGNEHVVELDIYAELFKSISHLLDDVHRLAMTYHWSEAEILALPSARRQQYLSRIDRARGMTGGEA